MLVSSWLQRLCFYNTILRKPTITHFAMCESFWKFWPTFPWITIFLETISMWKHWSTYILQLKGIFQLYFYNWFSQALYLNKMSAKCHFMLSFRMYLLSLVVNNSINNFFFWHRWGLFWGSKILNPMFYTKVSWILCSL